MAEQKRHMDVPKERFSEAYPQRHHAHSQRPEKHELPSP